MRVAVPLLRYFPFGGMQRDMLATARACRDAGHDVVVYCHTWEGARDPTLTLELLDAPGRSNHARARRFADRLTERLRQTPADVVIGFDKLPGLDLYFAADPCFVTRTAQRPWPYRLTPRYRTFRALEGEVFGANARTRVLLLDPRERASYQQVWQTPDERFVELPPGIARDRRRGSDAHILRAAVRRELRVEPDDVVLLMLGANLELKGVDRAMRALAAQPAARRRHVHLFAFGQQPTARMLQLARSLGVAERVHIDDGRDDVPALLQAADVLVHPARRDTTATVVLEALVAGRPVICTAACGHAETIRRAGCGVVLPEPFEQAALDRALHEMLTCNRSAFEDAGLRYADAVDLHGMHARIVQEVTALRR